MTTSNETTNTNNTNTAKTTKTKGQTMLDKAVKETKSVVKTAPKTVAKAAPKAEPTPTAVEPAPVTVAGSDFVTVTLTLAQYGELSGVLREAYNRADIALYKQTELNKRPKEEKIEGLKARIAAIQAFRNVVG